MSPWHLRVLVYAYTCVATVAYCPDRLTHAFDPRTRLQNAHQHVHACPVARACGVYTPIHTRIHAYLCSVVPENLPRHMDTFFPPSHTPVISPRERVSSCWQVRVSVHAFIFFAAQMMLLCIHARTAHACTKPWFQMQPITTMWLGIHTYMLIVLCIHKEEILIHAYARMEKKVFSCMVLVGCLRETGIHGLEQGSLL
jgi:hypothetical protein